MEQTVFVVTTGSYSDYGISAIFSTKEKAERYAKEIDSDNSIEEYVIDEDDEKVNRPSYLTVMDVISGEVLWVNKEMLLATPNERSAEANLRDFRNGNYGIRSGRLTVDTRSFIDQEHSRKLAAEFRQNWLREQSTGTPSS